MLGNTSILFLVNVHTLIKHTIQSDIYSNNKLICCSTILFLSHQHVNPFNCCGGMIIPTVTYPVPDTFHLIYIYTFELQWKSQILLCKRQLIFVKPVVEICLALSASSWLLHSSCGWYTSPIRWYFNTTYFLYLC